MSFAPITEESQGIVPRLHQSASQVLIQGLAGKILANAELSPIAQQAASMAMDLARGSFSADAGIPETSDAFDIWQVPELLSQVRDDPTAAIGQALAGALPSPAELQQRVQDMIGRSQPAEYEIVDGGAAPETATCKRTGMGFLFHLKMLSWMR